MEQKPTKDGSNQQNEGSVSRGKDAVKAHEELFDKHKPEDKKREDKEKDAEQWHNEG